MISSPFTHLPVAPEAFLPKATPSEEPQIHRLPIPAALFASIGFSKQRGESRFLPAGLGAIGAERRPAGRYWSGGGGENPRAQVDAPRVGSFVGAATRDRAAADALRGAPPR